MVYCVSLVFKKYLDEGFKIELISGLVEAGSPEEAIGKAIMLDDGGKLGALVLKSAIKCKVDDYNSFKSMYNNRLKIIDSDDIQKA